MKDVEIKALLKEALTDQVNDRRVYMKGIDASYRYEGYEHVFHGRSLVRFSIAIIRIGVFRATPRTQGAQGR